MKRASGMRGRMTRPSRRRAEAMVATEIAVSATDAVMIAAMGDVVGITRVAVVGMNAVVGMIAVVGVIAVVGMIAAGVIAAGMIAAGMAVAWVVVREMTRKIMRVAVGEC